jgi:hypothetical protein
MSNNIVRSTAHLALAAALAGLCALTLTAQPALAYNLEGQRWAGTPTSGCCANLTIQFIHFETGLDNAYGNWANYNGVDSNVNWYSGSSVATADQTFNGGVSWDGITYYNFDGSNNFTSANAWLNDYYASGYSLQDRIGVMSHEAGHQIGLAHGSGCVLMVPDTPTRSSCGVWTPQTDDLNGAKAVY